MDGVAVRKESFLVPVIKGMLVAISVSLVAILLFALVIRFTGISDSWIMPINQVIKIISIFLGCMVSVRHSKTKGLYKGLILGFLYTIFAFFLFAALSGSISFSLTFLNDLLFGSVVGGLCGIIAANLRRNR